jgi:hypothetical protein
MYILVLKALFQNIICLKVIAQFTCLIIYLKFNRLQKLNDYVGRKYRQILGSQAGWPDEFVKKSPKM